MNHDSYDQLERDSLRDLRAYVSDDFGDYADSDLLRGALAIYGEPDRFPEPVALCLLDLGYVRDCGAGHLVLTDSECERCCEAAAGDDNERGPCGIRADGEAA